MRCVAILHGVACLLFATRLEATAIKGRVVDSAGRPVAGAEVRVWLKGVPVNGVRSNEPVSVHDKQALLANEDGRFETPDIFDARLPLRVTAQAEGTLAGRSGWILPSDEVNEVDDIVLVPLRSIVGQVLDRQGAAIAGATVYNGDGHQRVETKTGSTGKFFLDGVPENALFLFAEKADYRLTGILLDGQKSVELRMARGDEAIEPLKFGDPVLSAEERAALGHRLLDPYLEAVSRQGNDTDKYFALHELSMIDPRAAVEWLDRVSFDSQARKDNCRAAVMMNWMQSKRAHDWAEIRTFLESSENNVTAANSLICGGAYYIPETDIDRRREWLDQGLVRGRAIQDATGKVHFLAWGAEGFWRLGDRERATTLARKAEAEAEKLPRELPIPEGVHSRLARATAPIDLPRALQRLDQVKVDFQFAQENAFLALMLAPIDVDKAEEVWNHIGERGTKDLAFFEGRDFHAADFCFRIARTDPDRAALIVAAVKAPFWRTRARAAVARAVSGETAKQLLREAVADAELREIVLEPRGHAAPRTAAIALAALLPVAEEVDSVTAGELMWRILSLRSPQPSVDRLDDERLLADVALAQMIARYEPAIARRLLQPAVERLPQLASRADIAYKSVQVVVAAAFVDPNWAVEALDRLPEPPDVSWSRHPKNNARLFLVRMLGQQGSDYWRHAGFWEPEE